MTTYRCVAEYYHRVAFDVDHASLLEAWRKASEKAVDGFVSTVAWETGIANVIGTCNNCEHPLFEICEDGKDPHYNRGYVTDEEGYPTCDHCLVDDSYHDII